MNSKLTIYIKNTRKHRYNKKRKHKEVRKLLVSEMHWKTETSNIQWPQRPSD